MEELATSHMDFSMSQCDQCEDLKQRIKQLEAENKKKDIELCDYAEALAKKMKRNTRLEEALEIIANDKSLSFIVQQIAQKALEDK